MVFCQAADTVTTLHATSLGAEERNPFVRWLLETTGPGGFIAVKAAAVAANNARVASQLSE